MGFQGVQGTITSVSSTHIIFDDAQGQAYSVAITSTTVIQQTTQAKASDLIVGSMVTALGTSASGGIAARSITIQG
jgi:Holliday junction resolvasome RuvABC DNA-binding subunit